MKEQNPAQTWNHALDAWTRVLSQAPDDDKAQRWHAKCLKRLTLIERAGSETPPLSSVTRETDLSGHERKPRLRNSAPRHIVIMGMSFCGSTLLGLVLGSLPGVANVGESHWLIQKRRQRSSEDLPTTPDGFEQCMSCGPDCSVVTNDLRQRLAEPSADFYATLAAAYGADLIVTTDKTPQHVLTLDPYLHNDTIVLFREPMANWQSHQLRHPAFASPEGQRDYFRNWADSYDILLRYFHNQGTKIVVSSDEFAASPQRVLALMCRTLSLPFDSGALAYWRGTQHFVGGNIVLSMRLRSGDEDALRIGPRPASPDADPLPGAADEFARARQVWEMLRRRQHECSPDGA